MDEEKQLLARSQAGMRLIAQTHIYNGGDTDRLRTYISESYTPAVLEQQPVEHWLAWFDAMRAKHGKLRVERVLSADKHRVIVVMEAQQSSGVFGHDLHVEEDYPHRIIDYYTFEVELT